MGKIGVWVISVGMLALICSSLFESTGLHIAGIVGAVALLSVALGILLFIKGESPEKFAIAVFGIYLATFLTAGAPSYILGIVTKQENYLYSGLFCLIQAVIALIALIKARKRKEHRDFRALYFYPLLMLIAPTLALMPGYDLLFDKLGGAFFSLMVFEQAKDLWQITDTDSQSKG